jgi:hypothetical protein
MSWGWFGITWAIMACLSVHYASASDRDRDGIDDKQEHELAARFRPYFIFDSDEDARRPGEPVVLYQVRAEGDAYRIVYAYLFALDGGYTESLFCGDRHLGDNQTVQVTVDRAAERLTHAGAGEYRWPRDGMFVHERTHPAIFLSSGKHHPFFDTSWDGVASPYSSWNCNDGVDGRGARVVAEVESARGWHNVGEPDAPLIGELDGFGFPGDHAWARTPFCGGNSQAACAAARATSAMGSLWMR